MMTVWVVMYGDVPAHVAATEREAERYVLKLPSEAQPQYVLYPAVISHSLSELPPDHTPLDQVLWPR